MPDYRNFKNSTVLMHSSKGSEWEKHQYVKKIDGVYYYPVGYKKGRTVDSVQNQNKKKKDKNESTSDENKNKKVKTSKKEIRKLANDVISGKYGVGVNRQQALGKRYNRVQNRVNVILLGKDAAKRIRERKQAARTSTTKTKSKSFSSKKK